MSRFVIAALSLLLLSDVAESRKSKKSKKKSKNCFDYLHLSDGVDNFIPGTPQVTSIVTSRTTLADHSPDTPPMNIKAIDAATTFIVIQISDEEGFPQYSNQTMSDIVTYDDGSMLTTSGFEEANLWMGKSQMKWVITGGSGKLEGATGEGRGGCDVTVTPPCTYSGTVCLN